jgi:hypothetical protein
MIALPRQGKGKIFSWEAGCSLCGEVMIYHRGTEGTEVSQRKGKNCPGDLPPGPNLFSVFFSVSSVPLWLFFLSSFLRLMECSGGFNPIFS